MERSPAGIYISQTMGNIYRAILSRRHHVVFFDLVSYLSRKISRVRFSAIRFLYLYSLPGRVLLVSLLAPKHLLGLTGGVFNFIGGLSAVVIPVLIGFLVRDGSFTTPVSKD